MKTKERLNTVNELKNELIDMGIKPNLGLNDIVEVMMVDEDALEIVRHMIVEVEHFTSSLTFMRMFRKMMIESKLLVREKELREDMQFASDDEDIREAMIRFFCCNVEDHEVDLFKKKYHPLLSSIKLTSLHYSVGKLHIDKEVTLRPKMIIDICM